CQGRGTNRGPEGRPSRQCPGLDCGGGPGGGAVALSGRGSTAAGFVTRRDDRRIPAGQLRASGEYTGRLFRAGKAVISGELAGVFERLGSNAENWQARLRKLAAGRLLGR